MLNGIVYERLVRVVLSISKLRLEGIYLLVVVTAYETVLDEVNKVFS